APPCRQIQSAQRVFFQTILHALSQLSPEQLDNTAVVVASGNAGVDLTQEFRGLQTLFPAAFSRTQFVGATNEAGAPVTGLNYASSRIVFSRGINVPTVPGCTPTGTSFAAPEIARILTIIWDAVDGLSSDKVVQAFQNALRNPNCAAFSLAPPQDSTGV